MLRKILAVESGHKIVAEFKDSAEYDAYCRRVVNECFDICLRSLSLEDVIRLWQERNPHADTARDE